MMYKLGVAAAALMTAVSAQAAEVVVLPSDSSWRITTGASTSARVTATEARSGNGSLELRGDQSRFTFGATNVLGSTINLLRDVVSLTFDWRIAGDTVSMLNPDYTPALRLLVADGFTFRELIWEGAYNGVYGDQTVPDTWYSTTANDKFYVGRGNENNGKTIAEWAASNGSWRVVGYSVGQGSSAGTGFHAFADNVTYTTTSGSTTYNFEARAGGAVPEPATWAMMMLGFGAMGFAMRRRKITTTARIRYA